MFLGYNTNGLAHHRLLDALALLAEAGYGGVALTIDVGVLDPYREPVDLRRELQIVHAALDRHGLRRVIETGARYLLNPRQKHDPTLMNPDPARRSLRIDFLKRAIDIAAELEADATSFWSGILPDKVDEETAFERLAGALRPVLEHAEARQMRLAFEPEPGMFIDTFAQFRKLGDRVRHPLFDVTVDIGHVHCLGEALPADVIRAWAPRIANIHVEDMVAGVHEHLMFGAGTIDFPPIFQALRDTRYESGLYVELSRHSHMGADALWRSKEFLAPFLEVG
jgi:sugar phosphate isomerase/epimerase